MSNELSTLSSLTQLPVSAPTQSLAKYGQETEFLQRIQLYTKGEAIDSGKIAPGRYGVPGSEDVQDLGDAIDVLPIAFREKALDTNGETPIACYDPSDPLFQDIVDRAPKQNSGCMFGPSFLVFERNTGKFYEFFCGSKSARKESGKFAAYLPISDEQAKELGVEAKGPTPMTLKNEYVKRRNFSWHVPVVVKCSTPITNLPPIEEIVPVVEKFLNPKTDNPELATEEEGRSR